MAGLFQGPLFVFKARVFSRKQRISTRKGLASKRYAQALFEYFKISEFLEDFSLS